MDADGLPIVGPGIDFTKVGAIHQKRTVAFLNHFITHTARFLNRFSCVCEERLEKLSVRIQRLETTMNLLEAKLSSIPGLENVTVPQSSNVSETAPTPSQPSSSQPSSSQQHNSNTTQEQPAPSTAVETPPAEPEKPKMTVSQDPRYQQYFKMVKIGVPPESVKMKMKMEGLDPDLIDNPDAPAPGGAPQKDDGSDDDFDDEKQESDSDSDASFSD